LGACSRVAVIFFNCLAIFFSFSQDGALQHEQVVVEALVYMVRVTSVQVKQ